MDESDSNTESETVVVAYHGCGDPGCPDCGKKTGTSIVSGWGGTVMRCECGGLYGVLAPGFEEAVIDGYHLKLSQGKDIPTTKSERPVEA